MLPYLKPKKMGTVMEANYSEGKLGQAKEEGEHSMGIMSAAEDLISAVHAKDTKGVADALKAHHEMREAEGDNFLSEDET